MHAKYKFSILTLQAGRSPVFVTGGLNRLADSIIFRRESMSRAFFWIWLTRDSNFEIAWNVRWLTLYILGSKSTAYESKVGQDNHFGTVQQKNVSFDLSWTLHYKNLTLTESHFATNSLIPREFQLSLLAPGRMTLRNSLMWSSSNMASALSKDPSSVW